MVAYMLRNHRYVLALTGHARHRRVLAPAFAPSAIKELLPVFHATAHKVSFPLLAASDIASVVTSGSDGLGYTDSLK